MLKQQGQTYILNVVLLLFSLLYCIKIKKFLASAAFFFFTIGEDGSRTIHNRVSDFNCLVVVIFKGKNVYIIQHRDIFIN